jgi:hypothetical protein
MTFRKGYWNRIERGSFTLSLFIYIIFFFIVDIPDSQANAKPEIETGKVLTFDLFLDNYSYSRNFQPKSDFPGSPLPARHPVVPVKPLQDDDRCFIQESFRLFADRGQNLAVLSFSGILTDVAPDPSRMALKMPVTFISSKTGECFKIRPPPII